jgi:hypothetical protein
MYNGQEDHCAQNKGSMDALQLEEGAWELEDTMWKEYLH